MDIQKIDDNGCFKKCFVKYLHLVDHHSARITRADKNFAKKFDFKDIKLPVKIRDIHEFESFGYENKVKYSIYVLKTCREDKDVHLLLIEVGRKHYFFIK